MGWVVVEVQDGLGIGQRAQAYGGCQPIGAFRASQLTNIDVLEVGIEIHQKPSAIRGLAHPPGGNDHCSGGGGGGGCGTGVKISGISASTGEGKGL